MGSDTRTADSDPLTQGLNEALVLAQAMAAREQDVASTLVRLADTLVEDFDVLEALGALAEDCVRLLGVTAAGLLLAGPAGVLHVVAASSEETRLLELFQLQRDEGPCLDCYRSGETTISADMREDRGRWPLFTQAAAGAGFLSVHAIPLRLRSRVLGALNLFGADPGVLGEAEQVLGRALADMATITVLHERALRESELVAQQLQLALSGRVVLEQAKGVLAERGALDMEGAFAALRGYARNHNLRLKDVSSRIVDGTLDPDLVIARHRGRH